MKALVLAGGSGTRLRPITHTSAKQLLPIANKPVLFYGLEAIAEAGITDVGLVVGATATAIQAAVGDGSQFGIQATYIPQEAPLGLAHAVLIARDFLGDDDFVMYVGDIFIVGGISDLVREFAATRPDAQIMLTRVSNPGSFGVAELDEHGRVVRLEEKPQQPKTDLALVGVYVFTPAVHEAVRALKPSWRDELEITDAIQWLIDQGKDVRSTMITGYWRDTGNVADMLEVNRLVMETVEPRLDGVVDAESEIIGRVLVEADAHVTGSRIVGPAIIGAGSKISGSYVGPFTAIAPDCAVYDSEIEYSIVLRGASIRGVRRIEASLIGHDVEVTPAPRVPRAHRLILGDHSKVQISSLRNHVKPHRRLAGRPLTGVVRHLHHLETDIAASYDVARSPCRCTLTSGTGRARGRNVSCVTPIPHPTLKSLTCCRWSARPGSTASSQEQSTGIQLLRGKWWIHSHRARSPRP